MDHRPDKNLVATKKRLQQTLYLLPVAFLVGIFGAFFGSLKIGLILFAICMILWSVCTYIAFMHYWAAKDARHKN